MFNKDKKITKADESKQFLDELESILGLMKKYQVTQITKGDLVITKNIHDNPDFKEEKPDDNNQDDDLFYSS